MAQALSLKDSDQDDGPLSPLPDDPSKASITTSPAWPTGSPDKNQHHAYASLSQLLVKKEAPRLLILASLLFSPFNPTTDACPGIVAAATADIVAIPDKNIKHTTLLPDFLVRLLVGTRVA